MDMGTLSFSAVLVGSGLAFVTITMAAFRRKRGITIFAASFVVAVLGSLLLLLEASLPPWIGVFAGNALLFCFHFGMVWGLRALLGYERAWPLRFTFYAAVWLAVLLSSTLLIPCHEVRGTLSSAAALTAASEFLIALRRGSRPLPAVVRRAVTAFILFFVGLYALRLAFIAVGFGASEPFSADNRLSAYTFAFSLFASVLWAGSILGIDAAILVSELEQKNAMLRTLAVVDELTGLSNRRLFEATVQAEIERSTRYGDPLSLILFDIDRFKAVNDNWGHHVGDAVLNRLADFVASRIRDPDSVFRWGGDEFVVLTPHTGIVGARTLAEQLRSGAAEHEFPEIGSITLSFGVAVWRPGMDGRQLFELADLALYRAKEEGRNRVSSADARV